ncbi:MULTISPECIES: maleylacetoacetate isomerase [Rhodopseudomonas]|uniref:Maleylacetoacetate isomerase n=1 Tax=Rhodopseudomonas palustris TaxID=1076 RepID=A0A0D7F4I2_RHOPL|nr:MULTISPECIES: maleylacetoacetate isomerase [Rhodopseudomonas]KIZ47998.1 maleylacetoacetate isomerase [Rhodopseudomonas palustris]MDF3813427.1 maleylacetoacetate isomerase [Rhodopseudomonas sp. BAL398]WOK15961.1 maleylacetoacetate isomerase [Rhodopseudomonas sp. BAL398]
MTKPPQDHAAAVLYGYFRSSAAYRVRIALNLKGIVVAQRYVHLRNGEQNLEAFRWINPAGLVPYWSEGDFNLAQSLAIIEYLDESHPEPPLLPKDVKARAIVREIAYAVCCDIHPLGNLRVLARLTELGVDATERARWSKEWIEAGFVAIEARLAQTPGPFAYGEAPTLADLCIVPQVFNARRFDADLAPFERIRQIEAEALKIEAFTAAEPGRQPDAE